MKTKKNFLEVSQQPREQKKNKKKSFQPFYFVKKLETI